MSDLNFGHLVLNPNYANVSRMILELRSPSLDLLASFLESIEEMRTAGETIWEGWLPSAGESPTEFITRLGREESHPENGRVPESTYWAVIGQEVVGRISLRHALTPKLEEFGGHIGYEVRPSYRRQGVAKTMLAKVLELPKAREIGRLLLTCAPDNIASNRTIQSNGGVLVKTAYVERFKRNTNYYWITVSP